MFFPLEDRVEPHCETAHLHFSSWHETKAIKCHHRVDLTIDDVTAQVFKIDVTAQVFKIELTAQVFPGNLLATQTRKVGRLTEDLHHSKANPQVTHI